MPAIISSYAFWASLERSNTTGSKVFSGVSLMANFTSATPLAAVLEWIRKEPVTKVSSVIAIPSSVGSTFSQIQGASPHASKGSQVV